MTDQRQAGPPGPRPDRLQRWFAAEVRAAEQDVARGLVTASGPRRGGLGRTGITGGVVAAGVVVLLVVALTSSFLGGAVGPPPSSGTGQPTAASGTVLGADGTPAPVTSPEGPLYPDGIPMTLGGEAVLRPTEAAAHAAASTDASTFLVGGWVSSVFPYAGCPLPSGSAAELALDAGFCASYLTEAPANDVVGPLKLHFEASVPGWAGAGAVIVRVHTHDPLAASCDPPNVDACEHAVVVDAMVWNGLALGSDGLPTAIEGQPTITVPDALDRLANSTDADPFLVRGWYASLALPCAYIPATVPPTPGSSLLPETCDPSLLGAGPIAIGQEHATASDLDLTLGPGVDAPPNGAVVLEIHGHDPASAACDPSIRVACEAAVVVDRVVWTASTGLVALAPSATPGSVEIPSAIDGQPVLRGAAFVDRVARATDATSFLVGGWTPVTPEVYFCAFPAPSPGASLDPTAESLCGGLWFLDAPGDPQGVLRGSPPWVAVRITVVTTVPVWGAPFVMRVHVQDRTVIEESLVWQGATPSR